MHSPEKSDKPKDMPLHTSPRCPFYGLECRGTFFMRNQSGTCSLTGDNGLCRMEKAGNVPEWKKCLVFNHKREVFFLEQLMGILVVEGTHGSPEMPRMSLREWCRHVLGPSWPY